MGIAIETEIPRLTHRTRSVRVGGVFLWGEGKTVTERGKRQDTGFVFYQGEQDKTGTLIEDGDIIQFRTGDLEVTIGFNRNSIDRLLIPRGNLPESQFSPFVVSISTMHTDLRASHTLNWAITRDGRFGSIAGPALQEDFTIVPGMRFEDTTYTKLNLPAGRSINFKPKQD